jgi:flagellar hook-associated protein 1
MRSTFHGLETARRGMFTQQTALQVTGNNISNANTPGYSRQRVNFVQTEPYPAASMNRPQIPGQMGTGVKADSIQRVREGFLDTQFRGENNKFGYWGARSEALEKMEDIMNEPSDNGLSKTLDQFWQSLQDLSVNPEDTGARSVVRQRGLAVAETFEHLSNSLTAIKNDLGKQIGVTVKEVNAFSERIAEINKQVSEIEPHGYLPNDLYDERDQLVDQLSNLVNIEVETVKSGGDPSRIATGIYNIKIVPNDSSATSVELITGSDWNKMSVTPNNGTELEDPTGDIQSIRLIDSKALLSASASDYTLIPVSQGKLSGLIESYGYQDTDGKIEGLYPEMLKELDNLAYSYATQFNEIHKKGFTLAGDLPSTDNKEFFAFDPTITAGNTAGAAKNLKLHDHIKNLNNIAASTAPDESGNGLNALELANVGSTNFSGLDDPNNPGTDYPITGTINSFYESLIGKMAVDSQQANRMTANATTLAGSVEQRRQSISGVSLDEEMTNMIQYQHAYNASARNITVIDEMLDKIINGMGVVGR